MEARLELHLRPTTHPEHLEFRSFPHQNDCCCGSWTRHGSQYILSKTQEAAIMIRRLFFIVFALLFALPGRAEVVRIEIKSRADLLGGKTFGASGAYEKISGKIHFAVDPRNSANRI